jgi:hypothetical protein
MLTGTLLTATAHRQHRLMRVSITANSANIRSKTSATVIHRIASTGMGNRCTHRQRHRGTGTDTDSGIPVNWAPHVLNDITKQRHRYSS